MSDKPQAGGQRYDRDGLYRWAAQRLGTVLAARKYGLQSLADQAGFFATALKALAEEGLTEEWLRTEPRSKIREKLLQIAPQTMPPSDIEEIDARIEEVFRGTKVAETEDAKELAEWAERELGLTLEPAKLTGLSKDLARHTLLNAYDQKYRPEMHSVERRLILEQIDTAWKSHLLVMDSLRSGVGLRGYGQEDPKIVYKREGMKEFETMWEGIRDRTTEAIFRIEEMGDDEAREALWAGARATHAAAISASQARQAQASAAELQTSSGEKKKAEPIRNTGAKVGRNDPCPCGSGKKYKNCHMKIEAGKR
ncbi:MAG: SEC-C metal-binding domain-containing protein [Gemmata sp.]|nr:SEC-C metal-binding domain-containing protein [Gemmata sp.]